MTSAFDSFSASSTSSGWRFSSKLGRGRVHRSLTNGERLAAKSSRNVGLLTTANWVSTTCHNKMESFTNLCKNLTFKSCVCFFRRESCNWSVGASLSETQASFKVLFSFCANNSSVRGRSSAAHVPLFLLSRYCQQVKCPTPPYYSRIPVSLSPTLYLPFRRSFFSKYVPKCSFSFYSF